MANPLVHGFKGLTRFSGRDRRKTFWPYAAAVIFLTYALGMVFGAIAMVPMFTQMSEYAAAHPEHATVTTGPGHYEVSIDSGAPDVPVPDMSGFMYVMAGVSLFAVVLLAAAVSRRLHDSGRSGFWGLMPVPFLATGMILMPGLMRSAMSEAEPDMSLFGLLFINNGLYFLALVTLIVLLCLPTKAGANRHGAEPV